MQIKPAKGLILLFMRLCGFDGWTSLWNTIYLREEHMNDERLIRHERCHINQIEREGRLRFAIKYMFYLVTKGYYDNPYEIEARNAENV